MPHPRLRQGLWAGLTSTAATLGVLLGLGRAHGQLFQPVNLLARPLVGGRAALVSDFSASVTIPGLVVLTVGLVIVGVVLAALAGRARLGLVVAGALVLTAAAGLANHALLPIRIAPRLDGMMSRAELLIVFVVMALGLALGARVAARTRLQG